MSKRLIYFGSEKCDFIFYMATVLSIKGSVLVIDNSHKGDLYEVISALQHEPVIEKRGITYVRDVSSKSNLKDFDYIVVYAGKNVEENEEFLQTEDEIMIVAMPDYTSPVLTAISSISYPLDGDDVVFIMRDRCSKKLSEKNISIILGISPKKIEGVLNLNMKDEAAYVALSHNGFQSIKGVSDDMQTAITFVTSKFFDTDEKYANKIVAKAKKIK